MRRSNVQRTKCRVDESLLSELRECLAQRSIKRGYSLLQSVENSFETLDPKCERSAQFVGYLAQWTDVGVLTTSALKSALRLFDPVTRSHLSLKSYLYLRMADGVLAMALEETDSAIRHFDVVLDLQDELNDPQSGAAVYFWKARCLRRKGEYEDALIFANRGRDSALALGCPCMAALTEVLESWILFQRGKTQEAASVSRHAESILQDTDDYVTLGNIYSFYGRMCRRSGMYDQAIEHFNQAINEYRKRDPKHPSLARSLANIALAKRAIALQLRHKIDRQAARRRKVNEVSQSDHRSSTSRYRKSVEQLRKEIIAHLDEAAEIYERHPNHHGIGNVNLNYAYLLLDDGDYEGSENRAMQAYRLGEEKQDYILMGRARIVLCMVENARVEEEISEGSDPGSNARRAMEYVQEAVDFAKHTQNKRLITTAYLWLGLTYCNDFFDNTESAREAYDLAVASRSSIQPDNMWEDLQLLRSKVIHSGSIDSKLQAWSQGSLGGKTFREITEEFAELIIPRVWEREGRKIARVATRLSISPKKVRRILNRVGHSTLQRPSVGSKSKNSTYTGRRKRRSN